MTKAMVGIIGGSGIYDLPGLENIREEKIASPWGEPSDALRFGSIGGREVVFLARHGRGHRLSPCGINYRANIDVMKRAGVTDIVSVSACGSLKPELYPGLFIAVDQFVDRTHQRASSFFGNGCVAHVPFANPVAPLLSEAIIEAAKAENIAIVKGGTYICMEGPQFSTYAEALLNRDAGFSVIGMTAMPEAKLAREAEISYAMLAMVTDFDCWHPEHDDVDVAAVIRVVHDNAQKAAALLVRLLRDFPQEHPVCPIGSDRALEHAIMTAPNDRDPGLLSKLDAVAGRVLKEKCDE